MPELTDLWGVPLAATVCEACDIRYLLSPKCIPATCPYCIYGSLTPLPGAIENPTFTRPPELILPFTLSQESLVRCLQNFTGGFWFAPADLQPQSLVNRLQRVYLPLWLVDSQVEALWQAEAGFEYQVISHQDSYDENQGGWISRQVTETRIRWEPRLGRLNRAYHNISTPALEAEARLEQQLGPYDLAGAQAYRPSSLAQAMVWAPDRAPADAWSETLPTFQAAAAAECRQASRADHLRDFRWSPHYHNRHWTLLLRPVYTTFYLDDQGQPQLILIQGQTGRLSGRRRASMKRAQRVALVIGGLALFFFVSGLLLIAAALLMPRLAPIAMVGMLAAIIVGLVALLPLFLAWQFNRSQARQ